ncbi:hypothetical protein HPC49_12920 [Pyxidicoccus fallax]|uniref:Phosphate-selective porin O and P n=1 Tax=Pyxidicoccus fallax TaxID=394095 RepID=A0A848LLJ0_9BACT|nr:hypothetical protein [Pyxidicoccus fallax]NMO18687.1 hypothetical protein [Pyxidicoccus fallax]NPC79138.1 hypothetical protein [Pyxidicoccus fallax]
MRPNSTYRVAGPVLALHLVLSPAGAVAAEGALTFTPPRISGFIQPHFTWEPGDEEQAGEFHLRRLQVRAAGDLGTPALGYTVSLELATPRRPLRECFMGVRGLGHELRFGQFKVPFGWEFPVSVTQLPIIDFSVVQPLSIGRDPRDIGLGLFGTIDLGRSWTLEDGLAVVSGEGANTADTTPKKDVFARVGLLRGQQLRVGLSAATVEFTREDTNIVERSTRVGIDLGVEHGPVRVLGEYARAWFVKPEARTAHAFYGTVIACVGPGIEVLGRYEQRVPKLGADERLRFLTLGANYTHEPLDARVQLNYRRNLEADNNEDLLALQAQYVF